LIAVWHINIDDMLEPAASSPGAALLRLRTCIRGVCVIDSDTLTLKNASE